MSNFKRILAGYKQWHEILPCKHDGIERRKVVVEIAYALHASNISRLGGCCFDDSRNALLSFVEFPRDDRE